MGAAPRIIVVDDDEDVRFALQGLLSSAGHNAATFASAEEALAHPDMDAIDCVITDLQMGRVDGLEFARRLREHYPAVPILLITAFPVADIERRAAERNLLFLSKPFEANEMLAAVERMLSTRPR